MNKIIIVFVFIQILGSLLIPRSLYSQDFIDLINTGVSYFPKNTYESSPGTFKYYTTNFNIQYPYVFKNKDIFLTKVSYNNYNIVNDSTLKMYIIYLQLGMQKKISEKTSLKFSVTPKIASQLTDINKNDFIIPVTALIQFKSSDKFTYGFGLFYSREFFGNFMFPMIHANWKINKNWFFYTDFPSYGYLMYYPNKTVKAGFYASSSTNSIRLSEKFNSNYIKKSYAEFSLFLDLYFTKNIVLRTKGGYSTMRGFDMYKSNDTVPFTFSIFEFNDTRTQLNDGINGAPFMEFSLIYRYHY